MQQRDKKRILYTLIWSVGMSVCLVFLFLFLIQWDYLRAERIVVSGAIRLSEADVLQKAGLKPGVNIFSVNLSRARKRLLSHSWIAEAKVSLRFPPEIRIRIKEHEPLAVFELDEKYLANTEGKIFKKWDPLDSPMLPVVRGLRFSDIEIAGIRSGTIEKVFELVGLWWDGLVQQISARWRPSSNEGPFETEGLFASGERSHSLPFKAVMNVLQFGLGPKRFLPNGLIQDIRVDREMGITLLIAPENKGIEVSRIRLGYHNYPAKFFHLQQLFRYLDNEEHHLKVHSIDLNNLDRIVVSPKETDSLSRDYKEDI